MKRAISSNYQTTKTSSTLARSRQYQAQTTVPLASTIISCDKFVFCGTRLISRPVKEPLFVVRTKSLDYRLGRLRTKFLTQTSFTVASP